MEEVGGEATDLVKGGAVLLCRGVEARGAVGVELFGAEMVVERGELGVAR